MKARRHSRSRSRSGRCRRGISPADWVLGQRCALRIPGAAAVFGFGTGRGEVRLLVWTVGRRLAGARGHREEVVGCRKGRGNLWSHAIIAVGDSVGD